MKHVRNCNKVFHKGDRDSLVQDLHQMASRLVHRVDAAAYWINQKHSSGLAHTRLSIVDLDRGLQPIQNEDRSLTIVVNGELYDYKSWRQQQRSWPSI